MAKKQFMWDHVLDVVSNSQKNLGWNINKSVAKDITRKFNLKFNQGKGDVMGESSAIFPWKDTQIRLKKEFPGGYVLYNGQWEQGSNLTSD
jgi:hypothetical protein